MASLGRYGQSTAPRGAPECLRLSEELFNLDLSPAGQLPDQRKISGNGKCLDRGKPYVSRSGMWLAHLLCVTVYFGLRPETLWIMPCNS